MLDSARTVELHGFLRTSVSQTTLRGGPVDLDDRSGVSLDNIRLSLDADVQDVRLYLAFEGSTDQGQGYLIKEGQGGELVVLDAWAALDLSDWIAVQVGQFRPPILFTSMIDENELLFFDRTFNGLVWQEREPGAQLHLVGDPFEGWLAVQDGVNGEGSEVALTGRLAWRLFGEGEAPRREGAYDPDLGQTLYVAASWHDDASVAEGTALAAEAHYTWERLYLAGEVVDYADGLLGHRFWSATGSLALVPERWELSARYEDFSSRSDTYVLRFGLTRYLRGPTTKVLANVVRLEHDGADQVRTLFELGLVASF